MRTTHYKQTFSLPGLHTPQVAQRVEALLSRLPGITRFELDRPRNRLHITYEAAQWTKEQLLQQLRVLGLPNVREL